MLTRTCTYPTHCGVCRSERELFCCDCGSPMSLPPRKPRAKRAAAIEPWRFLLAAALLIAIIPVALVAGASPVFNGADLALLICLAAYVAVFCIPGRN